MTIKVVFELHDGLTVGPLDHALALRCLKERAHKIRTTELSIDNEGWLMYSSTDRAQEAIERALKAREEMLALIASRRKALSDTDVTVAPAVEEMKRRILTVDEDEPDQPAPRAKAKVAAIASSRCFRCGHSLLGCRCGPSDPNEQMKHRDRQGARPMCAPTPGDWEQQEKSRAVDRALRKTFSLMDRCRWEQMLWS